MMMYIVTGETLAKFFDYSTVFIVIETGGI